jgi:hypothetical protein
MRLLEILSDRFGAFGAIALQAGTDLPGHPIQFVACNRVLLARIKVSQPVERDEVNVQMRDAVALYRDSDAISPRGLFERDRKLLSAIPQVPVAGLLQVEEIVDVLTRDEQQVTGLDRVMVEEGNELRVLPYDCRGSPPRHDLAEDTAPRFHWGSIG